MHKRLRVLDIVKGTAVDGPGLRTSIYFAGCDHRCPGCHNPQSWDMSGGNEMSVEELVDIVDSEGFNVTFTGGDPIYQLDALLQLAERLHSLGYSIWLYTGFTADELVEMEVFDRLIPHFEAIVDGPYIEALRDTALRFRGSSNQRIIYLQGNQF